MFLNRIENILDLEQPEEQQRPRVEGQYETWKDKKNPYHVVCLEVHCGQKKKQTILFDFSA